MNTPYSSVGAGAGCALFLRTMKTGSCTVPSLLGTKMRLASYWEGSKPAIEQRNGSVMEITSTCVTKITSPNFYTTSAVLTHGSTSLITLPREACSPASFVSYRVPTSAADTGDVPVMA